MNLHKRAPPRRLSKRKNTRNREHRALLLSLNPSPLIPSWFNVYNMLEIFCNLHVILEHLVCMRIIYSLRREFCFYNKEKFILFKLNHHIAHSFFYPYFLCSQCQGEWEKFYTNCVLLINKRYSILTSIDKMFYKILFKQFCNIKLIKTFITVRKKK